MDHSPIELLKRKAAERAAALVNPGMKLGLGTGSTAAHFVDCIGEKRARRPRGHLRSHLGAHRASRPKNGVCACRRSMRRRNST